MPWTTIASSADPQRVIGRFLAGGAEIAPEPVYLAWLLSLEAGHDPAEAAAALLAALPIAHPTQPPAAARLLALLADTTLWPRDAVAALAFDRRRSARVS
jgi:hypothetical protein